MFSVQAVPSVEDDVRPVDVQCANETQSVSEMTSHDLGGHDLGGHNIGQEGEGHSLQQVKTDSTSVQGSYVSLLADIATIEQTDGYSDQQITHGMPSSADYANPTYTGQEQIQALTESVLSSTLPNESLVSYQPVHNQNIGYSLNNPGGNNPALQQYVIIQPIVSSFFGENSASGSSTLIHIPNTSDNQLSLDSNKELEDAVANITEKVVLDSEVPPNNEHSEVSPEKSYLVSTNRRGEVRGIQVLHSDQSAVLPVGEADLSVYKRRGQVKGVKNKQKKISLNKRKEYSSHLKKFSLDDLNSTGKTKKEVFEEYFEKSKLKNDVQNKVTDKSLHSNNEEVSFPNEQNELVERSEEPIPDDSGASIEVDNVTELMLNKHVHTNEEIAESVLDQSEENRHGDINTECVKFDVIEHSTEPMTVSQGIFVNERAEGDQTKTSFEAKDMNTNTIIKTRRPEIVDIQGVRSKTSSQILNQNSTPHVKRTRGELKDIQANTSAEKDSDVKLKSVALKRRKQMPHELKKTSKLPKLIESDKKSEYSESDSLEDNIDSRVLEDFCRFFKSDDKCVLHLEPITLKLVSPKELLVIEMEVENEFKVSSVEKGVSANGFTKYYMNLSIPDQVDDMSFNNDFHESEPDKLQRSHRRPKKKKLTSIKGTKVKLNKKTDRDQISMSVEETVSENVISSFKEDGTDHVDKFDDIENLENDKYLSDTELLDTNEDACIPSEEIKSDSQVTFDESRTNAESDTSDKPITKISAKCKRKKGGRLAKQKKLEEEEENSKRDTQEATPQQNYQVVVSEEGIRMYMCPVCGYMSKYPQNARKHIYEHTATKDWICEMCGMSFKSNNSLQKHRIVHQKDRPFPCPLCPQKFKRKRVYRCFFCGKEMSIRQNMDVHVNQHTGRRPWQCEICGLGFKGPSNLRAHKHQHDEEMRFSCSICFKKFRDRGTYRQHLKRHLGEKKHVCEHCGKSFVISSDLKKHIRTHTGEKPFKCSVCEQQFSDGSSLVRHEKMHAAKFRYECSVCRRQYSRKDLCKKHINTAHSDMGPVEVNQVSIEEDRQIPRDTIKTARTQDGHTSQMHRASRKSSNRETAPKTRMKKLKKSWQTLTEEASKRYKEHSIQNIPGVTQYGEYSQPVGPTFSVIDYQPVQTLYGNMNQKFSGHKPQIPVYGSQDMITPQGPIVYQPYVSEPGRF